MQLPISRPIGGARRAGAAGFRRVVLRIVGAGLFLDALCRLVAGRSLVDIPPLRQVSFLLTRGQPEPRPPRWKARLLGLGEGAAAFTVLGAAPLASGEIAQAAPNAYQHATRWLDRTLLAPATTALVHEIDAASLRSGRLLLIGDPGRLLGPIAQRGVAYGTGVVVDESEAVLGLARQRYRDLPNVTFLQRNLEIEPIPGVAYDVAASNWTTRTPSDPIGLVNRVWQALGPNGTVLLLLPTDPGTWWSALLRPIRTFLGARPVDREVVEQLPGLRRVEPFAGGLATLAVLRKD